VVLRLHVLLRAVLYVAAILVLPGALIGAPILWWINHRNGRRAGSTDHAKDPTGAHTELVRSFCVPNRVPAGTFLGPFNRLYPPAKAQRAAHSLDL
jgi:hypothetical protein